MNSVTEFLSSTLLSGVILNAFIRLTVVSIIGWSVMMLLRNRPASARNTVSIYTLFTLLLITLLSPMAKYSGTRIVTLDLFRTESGKTTAQAVLPSTSEAEATPTSTANKISVAATLQADTVISDIMLMPDIPRGSKTFLTRENLLLAVNAFGLLWAAGTAILLLHLLYGLIFLRGFRSGLKKLDSNNITSLLGEIEKSFPKRGGTRVYLSPVIHSPVAVGIMRPIVILPESLYETATETELKSIFLHELAHINRLDHILGLFQRIILALNWWNPLVHHINKACSITKEEISDNYAIRGIGSARLYSECLINLADKVCLISNLPATAGMAGKYISLEKRITNIIAKDRNMKTNTGTITKVAGCMLMLATAICFAGSGVDVSSTSDQPNNYQDANDNPEIVIKRMAYADYMDQAEPNEFFTKTTEYLNRDRDNSEDVAITLLNSEDPMVSTAAVMALTRIGNSNTVDRLLKLLNHKSNNQEMIISALSGLRDKRAVEPLTQLLDSQHEKSVRLRACMAVSRLRDKRGVEPLTKLLKDPDPEIQARVCMALAKMGEKGVIPTALELLDSGSPNVASTAAYALQLLGDKRAIPYALNALSSTEERTRFSAARLLAAFGDERALKPLVTLLDSKNPSMRFASSLALEELKDKRAIKPLKERQKTETLPLIQQQISRTLKELESAE